MSTHTASCTHSCTWAWSRRQLAHLRPSARHFVHAHDATGIVSKANARVQACCAHLQRGKGGRGTGRQRGREAGRQRRREEKRNGGKEESDTDFQICTLDLGVHLSLPGAAVPARIYVCVHVCVRVCSYVCVTFVNVHAIHLRAQSCSSTQNNPHKHT